MLLDIYFVGTRTHLKMHLTLHMHATKHTKFSLERTNSIFKMNIEMKIRSRVGIHKTSYANL